MPNITQWSTYLQNSNKIKSNYKFNFPTLNL